MRLSSVFFIPVLTKQSIEPSALNALFQPGETQLPTARHNQAFGKYAVDLVVGCIRGLGGAIAPLAGGLGGLVACSNGRSSAKGNVRA